MIMIAIMMIIIIMMMMIIIMHVQLLLLTPVKFFQWGIIMVTSKGSNLDNHPDVCWRFLSSKIKQPFSGCALTFPV